MENRNKAVCPGNEEVAAYLLNKRQELAQSAKGISENMDMTLSKAYSNICNCKTPIKTLRDLSQIKYMLTEEGKEVARECLLRSNINDANKSLDGVEGCPNFNQRKKSRVDVQGDPDVECINGASVGNAAVINLKKPKISIDVPTEYLDKFVSMGFSREQIIRAFSEVKETSQRKEISSLWPSVLCRLREDDIYGSTSVPKSMTDDHHSMPSSDQHSSGSQAGLYAGENIQPQDIAASSNQKSTLHDFARRSCNLKACSSTDYAVSKLNVRGSEPKPNTLAMPPLAFGENFGDVYEVVLILDNREQFATQGSRSRKIIENICSQFQIQIEVRRLPVGDGIWVARHKYLGSEYVLDFIVERKKVEDLRHSIRDNRYRDQKMRLVRCGLKKMIYLVEGDPNSSEAAESIKTACFTTEILEGFDVQRTSGLADTLKKYGYLTRSINQYYKSLDSEQKFAGVCPPFDEFIRTCEELDKMTVSDVFAVQLMQVPQVTEDIALAVLDMYPTLLSLARAYSLLDGDVFAQEEMLKRQSNNLINGSASKNIFYLVWGT
ncbi:UNVERIFIED_CONTAM: Crossover junction endonuclease MUS81 [Sesamum indicum]